MTTLTSAATKETLRVLQYVVEQGAFDDEVVKDESIERSMALGLLETPGVAIDGKVPKAEEVRQLLRVA